jgi:hypothetical protein
MTLETSPSRIANLLMYPWSECESVISEIGKRKQRTLGSSYTSKKWNNLSEFLRRIDFIAIDSTGNVELNENGKEFYTQKFILKDERGSSKILSESLKTYLPTQAICQLLWGRPNINKESVYRLLLLEEYIDNEFKEQDLGAYLMLLNQCGIIRYDKKNNLITIIYNPKTLEDFSRASTKFLSPETPFTNVRHFKEVLRNSNGFIHWFDKYFSSKGLDPVIDEADGTKVSEIKILGGLFSGKINERLRDDCVRLTDELKSRQIKFELRVLCDRQIFDKIHDRWVISRDSVYNVPPIDAIFRGQYSEVKETNNRPPFEDWWSQSYDIATQWNEINKRLTPAQKQSKSIN